jgi:HD-GYP domain-containing protein (c-di-GMP phosphodiesterase class II)
MPGRWAARPWRARTLRALVYAIPIAASFLFIRVATALTGTPTSSLYVFLAWWFGMSAAATVVVSLIYAATRRLLPMSALLELALAFPREAPSRFRLALATGTVEDLTARLRDDPGRDPQEACEILLQLVALLDDHDRITRGHAERVRAYAVSLGRELGLDGDDLDRLNWSALLHDIGKLRVDREILNKPGRPSDAEWRQLRDHPLYGETLVTPLRPWLGEWADAVGYHHERWDGGGYPRGVAGEEIPLAGRIVAIADVYDVITSSRSYKEAGSAAAAREELARCSGSQFDPRLVRAFVNISLGRMRVVMGPLSWLTHAPYLSRLSLTPSLGVAAGGISALSAAAVAGMATPHATATAAVREQPATPVAVVTHARPARKAPAARATVIPKPKHAHRHPPARKHVVHRPKPVVRHAKKPVATATTTTTPTPTKRPTTAEAAAPTKPETPTTPAPTPTTTAAAPTVPTPTTPTKPKPTPAPTPPPPPPTTTTVTTTTTATPPPPPPNTAPTFHAGAGQTVLEDSGTTTVPGWASGISAGETGQTVGFATSVSSPQLFASQPAVATDGTLTFTPAANANGAATVTVVAHDDGGTTNGGRDTSDPQTFTITVVAVNDAPTFTRGGNQTVVSLLGGQTVTGWASGISPGPPDEAAQTVSFSVSVDRPSLFSTQPAIAADGTLTYRPKALALGSATVTVRAVDTGGTANGGVDTSAPVTFTITIV